MRKKNQTINLICFCTDLIGKCPSQIIGEDNFAIRTFEFMCLSVLSHLVRIPLLSINKIEMIWKQN